MGGIELRKGRGSEVETGREGGRERERIGVAIDVTKKTGKIAVRK